MSNLNCGPFSKWTIVHLNRVMTKLPVYASQIADGVFVRSSFLQIGTVVLHFNKIYSYLFYFVIICYILLTSSQSLWRGTKCDCKEMKYIFKFIFPFLRSGVDTRRSVKLRHSTRNGSKIRQKVGNEVS